MRPCGLAAELEKRRRRAVACVQEQGMSPGDVAEIFEVHERTVRGRPARFRDDGDAGLAAKPQPGRPCKPDFAQEARVLSRLRRSPTEFGFFGELWSARRVAKPVKKIFGVTFNSNDMSAWLTERDITPRKPQRVPRERNRSVIDDRRLNRWTEIQKKRAASAPASS